MGAMSRVSELITDFLAYFNRRDNPNNLKAENIGGMSKVEIDALINSIPDMSQIPIDRVGTVPQDEIDVGTAGDGSSINFGKVPVTFHGVTQIIGPKQLPTNPAPNKRFTIYAINKNGVYDFSLEATEISEDINRIKIGDGWFNDKGALSGFRAKPVTRYNGFRIADVRTPNSIVAIEGDFTYTRTILSWYRRYTESGIRITDGIYYGGNSQEIGPKGEMVDTQLFIMGVAEAKKFGIDVNTALPNNTTLPYPEEADPKGMMEYLIGAKWKPADTTRYCPFKEFTWRWATSIDAHYISREMKNWGPETDIVKDNQWVTTPGIKGASPVKDKLITETCYKVYQNGMPMNYAASGTGRVPGVIVASIIIS